MRAKETIPMVFTSMRCTYNSYCLFVQKLIFNRTCTKY